MLTPDPVFFHPFRLISPVTCPSFCYTSIYLTAVLHFLSVSDRTKYIPWFLSALSFVWPVSDSLFHSKDQSSLRHSTHFIELKCLPFALYQAKPRPILLHIFGETVPYLCVFFFVTTDLTSCPKYLKCWNYAARRTSVIMFVLTNSLLQEARYNLQIVLYWWPVLRNVSEGCCTRLVTITKQNFCNFALFKIRTPRFGNKFV